LNEAIMTSSSSEGLSVVLRRRSTAFAAAVALSGIVGFSAGAAAAAKQPSFATPEQAVETLLGAVQAGHTATVSAILGPGSAKLIRSGDPVADAQARDKFVSAYRDANEINKDGDKLAVLVVGKDGWTFPFPIVQRGGGWQFDASAGAEEIINRRIGANELNAIETCREYVDAQHEYAEADPNHTGYVEYAQQFLSSAGKKDGLYWPAAAGEDESPLGPLMASARGEGYDPKNKKARTPYHGYFYRILKGQGAAAQGGAYDYVVRGHMIGGFALVAFPAQYGVSGIMTFIVNHDGVVYERDLGSHTVEIAEKMTLFNPDAGWKTP
jgi:DUF2950 family protein